MKTLRRTLTALAAVALVMVTITGFTTAPVKVATLKSETWIDGRTVDLMIDSPSLGTTAGVRLFLPQGWTKDTTRTWPQLWLLHGCCDDEDYKSWDTYSDARAFTADKQVIVVMPSDGMAGVYTKWWNYGLGGTPDWETFHTTEVRQIVDGMFHGSQVRAVAGVSIGGYGAMEYAAEHKGLFAAAASYSGVPNTLFPGIPQVIDVILARTGTIDFLRIWGSPILQQPIWSANNPYDRVDELKGMKLYFSAGNGEVGPLDKAGTGQDFLIEPNVRNSQQSFTDRLKDEGIPFTADYYGAGTHAWPYWQRALHESWTSTLAPALGLPG